MRVTARLLFSLRAALVALFTCLPLGASAQVATLDWTIGETLLALDASVDGIAQVEDYHRWVSEPRVPDTVSDIGLRTQPNIELLAQLAPEVILLSPMFAGLVPRLEEIAPTLSLDLYTPGTDTWEEILTLTRDIGSLTERDAKAEALIEQTHAQLAALRERLPPSAPLFMVQFIDARHVRVFGANSLYDAVTQQLGLENAWQDATNSWGFAQQGIEVLARYPEARLVMIEPLPLGTAAELERSGLWRQLPSVRRGDVLTLAPVWSFGALPSAQRFAHLLVEALDDDVSDARLAKR